MKTIEDKIALMIPAYLRGELSEEERQEIETLAEKNPEVAADIAFQRNIKAALAKDENAFEPGDLGWAKLSKAMQESDISEARANMSTSEPKFWRYAAAILAVAAVGQAGLLSAFAINKKDDVQYVTASESSDVNAYSTRVAFGSEVKMSELTQALQSVNGVIVKGPSSLGLYQVQFETKTACEAAVANAQLWSEIVETVSNCE
jgi:anti-sigma-K factor RskA